MTKDIILCDIDGVIADCTHRLHYITGKERDYDAFYDACDQDRRIDDMFDFIRKADDDLAFKVFFITGRPERIREKTARWIKVNGYYSADSSQIIMRKDDDHRKAHIIKEEYLQHFDKDKILFAIDDDKEVCEMYRSKGINTLQVMR